MVAFPTETVYGLGADATNAAAVRRVFAIKGRPATNPVIVHVADVDGARRCVREWPAAAQKLAERFWPGPLTIVLPKSAAIAPEVTAGGDTVGVRVPDHPVALAMLREFARLGGVGVAAPSANRSSRVSPTTAQHVRDDLGEPKGDIFLFAETPSASTHSLGGEKKNVPFSPQGEKKNVPLSADAPDMILDGGPCSVGIESTVISLATPVPTVLRPGGVSLEQLREVLGEVELRGGVDLGPAQSPGRQEQHYAPTTRTVCLEQWEDVPDWTNLRKMILLVWLPSSTASEPSYGHLLGGPQNVVARWMPARPEDYAHWLYAELRLADSLGSDLIAIKLPPDTPEWQAVRDRIMRASNAETENH